MKNQQAHIALGKQLCNERTRQGMTQKDLAKLLGVTFQQVQKYENGVNRISAVDLVKVSALLKVPMENFFKDKPQSELLAGKIDLTLVQALRKLPPKSRKLLITLAEQLGRCEHDTRS